MYVHWIRTLDSINAEKFHRYEGTFYWYTLLGDSTIRRPWEWHAMDIYCRRNIQSHLGSHEAINSRLPAPTLRNQKHCPERRLVHCDFQHFSNDCDLSCYHLSMHSCRGILEHVSPRPMHRQIRSCYHVRDFDRPYRYRHYWSSLLHLSRAENGKEEEELVDGRVCTRYHVSQLRPGIPI
ncbi:hypothetical protein CGRA01v4_09515 [Colletotrichum graminicola]|nr:hypothetical protein CGRA01v4_09515 [Colletotrichum graminicola]